MNAQQHRQLQEARQRIARSRRVLQGDALRLANNVQTKLNWRLQSQQHPLAMLLGAVGVGVVASRLLSNLSGGKGWEKSLFRWAKSSLTGDFWRQLLAMVRPEREDDSAADEADATADEEASS